MRRRAKISRVQRKRGIASEVIMGRVGYVKAGYRWLRWHIFLVPIHYTSFFMQHFMQDKTNITL
ncbi:hypothetical protein DK077_00580 [Salmonella enterica subsp. enterica]|nr:hypothetical protein [Salmonella enterica subsp. enterica]